RADDDVVADVAALRQANPEDHGSQADDTAVPNDCIVHRRLEANEATIADVARAVNERVVGQADVSTDVNGITSSLDQDDPVPETMQRDAVLEIRVGPDEERRPFVGTNRGAGADIDILADGHLADDGGEGIDEC